MDVVRTIPIMSPAQRRGARLLIAPILAAAALLLVAVPAALAAGPLSGITDQLTSQPADAETTDGGLFGIIDDVLDPIVPEPGGSSDDGSVVEKVIEEVIDPVTDVVPDVEVEVSAIIQAPLTIVPTVEVDVVASTDVMSTVIQVAAAVEGVAEVATEVTADLPTLELDLSTEVGGAEIEPPSAAGEDALPPEDEPAEASQPPTAAMPDVPIRPVAAVGVAIASVGSSRPTALDIASAAPVAPPAPAAPPSVSASPTPPQIAERVVRAIEALAEASSSFMASSGFGLTVTAMLGILALVPPLLWGRLLPASALWRPMHVVLPLDPPG